MRDIYIRILSDLRKEEDKNGRPFDVKQRRCEDFKMTLLLHGWSPEDMPKKRNGIRLDKMVEQERRSTGAAEKKEHKRKKPEPEAPQRSKTEKDLLQIKKNN